MAQISEIMIGSVVVIIFVFATIGAGISLATSNDRPVTDINDGSIDYSALEESLINYSSTFNKTEHRSFTQKLAEYLDGKGFDVLSSLVETTQTAKASYNIIGKSLKSIFSGTEWIIGILISLLVFVMVIAAYKLWRSGT